MRSSLSQSARTAAGDNPANPGGQAQRSVHGYGLGQGWRLGLIATLVTGIAGLTSQTGCILGDAFTEAELTGTGETLGSEGNEGATAGEGNEDGDETSPGAFVLEPRGLPQVSYNPQDGTTSLVFQFMARGSNGVPLSDDDVKVDFSYRNHANPDVITPLSGESLIEGSSSDLASNVLVSLVLDASYSMLLHDPPAFNPMLEAARETMEEGESIWQDNAGTFSWTAYWFAGTIQQSVGQWQPRDISDIPKPQQNTHTKLYSAIITAANDMTQRYYLGEAAGERDSHVMLVLSDGADTYTWFGDFESVTEHETKDGAKYLSRSTLGIPEAYGPGAALEAVTNHPKLTTHVIGLGSEINGEYLQALARYGNGQYLSNPNTKEIEALFDRITREFSTVQTHGIRAPLPPGAYQMIINVRRRRDDAQAQLCFHFQTGDVNAHLLQGGC